MVSYDETLIIKKFHVEVAISYKEMGGQTSLFHQFTFLIARIIRQLTNLKCLTLRFFWSLIMNLRSHI